MADAERGAVVEVVWQEGPLTRSAVLNLPWGSRVRDAVLAASAADPDRAALGVWGNPVSAARVLSDGDRVEVYAPLLADPRAARRLRAAKRVR